MSSLNLRRGASLLAAVALAAGGLAVAPGAGAVPAPATVPAVVAPAAVTIPDDTTSTGTLHITKYQQGSTNGTATGLQSDDPKGTPISGVTFTATRLTFDLSTQAGWEDLAKLGGNTANVTAAMKTTSTYTGTTNASGVADLTGLPVAAYLVQETSYPGNVTPSEPFIVTIPMTDPTNENAWLYDVYVYPKNAVTDVKKTVSNADDLTVGSTLTYTIDADVPNLPTGSTIDNYQVLDKLDPRLTATAGDVTVAMTGTGAVTLTSGTDYTVTVADSPNGTSYVTVDFTATGRAKILAARKSGDATIKVRVTVNSTLTAQGSGSGEITNTAYVIPNTPATAWDPANPADNPPSDTPDSSTTSKYGKVKITKTGTDDKAAATYAGATFNVYSCSSDGTLDGDPLSVGGTTAFTTGSDGTATIDGLKNNDWTDGKEVTADTYYCLVETKAPSGYELQADPIPFQVLQSNATSDNSYTVAETVTDVPKNGSFTLPLTGAAGVAVLVLAGGLLVGGAVLLGIRNKRRNS